MSQSIYSVTFNGIKKNADWMSSFCLRNAQAAVDLTGADLKMRLMHTSRGSVMDMTTQNGMIIITDATNGEFEIRVPASDLTALDPGYYVHDLILVSGSGGRTMLWCGTATVESGVTP